MASPLPFGKPKTGAPRQNLMQKLTAGKTPDPLANVDYPGDLEGDARAELDALQQGFRDRAKAETDRFRLATDSEYWVAVCFKTREDKDAFLTAAGLTRIGDKYLDGYQVAAALGVDLDT